MPSSMVQRFSDPGEYAHGFKWTRTEIAVTVPGQFSSKVTRIALHRLWTQRYAEALPRVLHIDLAPDRAVIFFPTGSSPSLFVGAAEVPVKAIMRFSLADSSFQRSTGWARFATMSLPIADTEALGATFGCDFMPPRNSLIVTPNSAAMARLQKIHAAAGELAEHASDVIAIPEAARGLEHALLDAMANCLIATDDEGRRTGNRHHDVIMKRFYAVLEAHPDGVLHTPDMCTAIGVSNRTLTTCCNETLGMSPYRYLKLRQMHLARRALRRTDPLATTVTAIATDHGFWDLGRFATAYRELLGELPSATLHRGAEAAPNAWEHENLILASEIT